MMFAAQQLTFIGYYSDPRTAEATGYVPFSKRKEGGTPSELAERPYPPLRVRTPAEVDSERITADVVVDRHRRRRRDPRQPPRGQGTARC